MFKTNTLRYSSAIGLGLLLATLALLSGPSNYFSEWLAWVPVFYMPRHAEASEWVSVYLYWILLMPILAGIYTWNKRFFIIALVLVLVIHTAVVILLHNYQALGF